MSLCNDHGKEPGSGWRGVKEGRSGDTDEDSTETSMAQGQRVPLASPKYWLNQKYLNQWKSIRDLSPGTNHGSKSFIGADMASDGTSWPCEA